MTPLHVVNADLLNLLLASDKVDPNIPTKSKMTPLHLACVDERKDEAQILLDASADVNAVDASGSTPLDYAHSVGCSSVVDVLVAAGAKRSTSAASKEKLLYTARRQATL